MRKEAIKEGTIFLAAATVFTAINLLFSPVGDSFNKSLSSEEPRGHMSTDFNPKNPILKNDPDALTGRPLKEAVRNLAILWEEKALR